MAIVALRIRMLPESLEIDLNQIKAEAEKKITSLGAKNTTFEEELIAFGLKALIMQTAWPEEKSTDLAENALRAIKGLSSVETIDYRRAFG